MSTSPPTDAHTSRMLAAAAGTALAAPSVFNTQPWRWRLVGDALELYVDRGRQLWPHDPAGRLMIMSCGVALHHARTALAAAGNLAEVARMPDPASPDLLARLRLAGRRQPDPQDVARRDAIARRRTDRRAFTEQPVPPAALDRLRAAAHAEGASLHLARLDQMPMLAIAILRAGQAELADPDYRTALAAWTNRPPWSGDGVPAGTAVRPAARRVPVRALTLDPEAAMPAGPGGDRGASYLILHGDQDEPPAWLRAGEALSATLLAATADGLSTAPISDVIEVRATRDLLRGLLPGAGHPYVVVRVGYGPDPQELPPTPRRAACDVIVVD